MANNIIDVEGQKIQLGEDFTAGQFSVSDLISIITERLQKSDAWAYASKALKIDDFLYKLKRGDTDALILAGVSFALGTYIAFMFLSSFASPKEVKTEPKEEEEPEPQRDFTIDQLREFDGIKRNRIYIALRGEVYDVTNAKDFYGEGSGYHCFAGREASRAMARLSFEEEDLANLNLSDLGPFERSTLDDWVQKFKYYKCYPIKGKVSVPPAPRDFTRSELLAFNGTQLPIPDGRVDAPIYVCLNGTVMDVSYGGKEMYAVGGPYHIFAGKDASRALAKMSFNPEDVSSSDLSDLTEEQRVVLADWEKKFVEARKYPVVGKVVE